MKPRWHNGKRTNAQLKKELDKVFSEYIRKKEAVDGYNVCFTCKTRKQWKELQCGHYISRSHLSLRFDERNCHPQCVGCNIFKSGAMDLYALELIALYGTGILDELNREKQKITKDFPYDQKIAHYKEKTKELELHRRRTKSKGAVVGEKEPRELGVS